MTDLPKRLEAAGRIKAEDYFKAKMPHLWKEYDLDLDRSHTMRAYVDCHSHLHPLIQKMAEALEKINEKAFLDTIRCECCDDGIDGAPCTCFTYNSSELLGEARNISRDAIAELEKYLGGV